MSRSHDNHVFDNAFVCCFYQPWQKTAIWIILLTTDNPSNKKEHCIFYCLYYFIFSSATFQLILCIKVTSFHNTAGLQWPVCRWCHRILLLLRTVFHCNQILLRIQHIHIQAQCKTRQNQWKQHILYFLIQFEEESSLFTSTSSLKFQPPLPSNPLGVCPLWVRERRRLTFQTISWGAVAQCSSNACVNLEASVCRSRNRK